MYNIYVFNGKGRLLRVLETKSGSLARLYALQNTTPKGHIDVVDAETGEVMYTVTGQGKDYPPKVTYEVGKMIAV